MPLPWPNASKAQRLTLKSVASSHAQNGFGTQYAQNGFATQRCPNTTHRKGLGPRGVQTVRTEWFGAPKPPKPYAENSFGRRPNLTRRIVLGPRGTQTLRTVYFGEPEPPKPYAKNGLWTQREAAKPSAQYALWTQILTHRMVLGPRGTQTLRTAWFWDPEAPKPYAQYGFGTQRRPNLTHSMVLGPRGAQTLRTV